MAAILQQGKLDEWPHRSHARPVRNHMERADVHRHVMLVAETDHLLEIVRHAICCLGSQNVCWAFSRKRSVRPTA